MGILGIELYIPRSVHIFRARSPGIPADGYGRYLLVSAADNCGELKTQAPQRDNHGYSGNANINILKESRSRESSFRLVMAPKHLRLRLHTSDTPRSIVESLTAAAADLQSVLTSDNDGSPGFLAKA